MNLKRFRIILATVLLTCMSAFGQTTSSLTGRVTSGGTALPGVTVPIASPRMQGSRTAVSDVNGNDNFTAIPPATTA